MAHDSCHLFNIVDEDTLMEPKHILYQTSPLFETLLHSIHNDGSSIADVPLYNPQIMEYQF